MAYDPHRAKVTALLNLDGTNGTSVFPDLVGNTWTVEGNIVLSNARSPYAGATCSALCDGNGDGLYFANSSGALISYQTPYTIECWAYITGNGAAGNGSGLWGQTYNGGNGDQGLRVKIDGTLLLDRAAAVNGGTSQSASTAAGVVSANAWHHFAETYDGTTIRVFVDGVHKIAVASTRGWNITTQPFRVGRILVPSYSTYRSDLQGNIAGFRLTNEVCRWVEDFAAAPGPYNLNGSIVAGTVTKDNAPAVRQIAILRLKDSVIVGVGTSDSGGNYSITTDADPGESLIGLAYPDYGEPPVRSMIYAVGARCWVGTPAPYGHWYECEAAGTSGTTEPTWPTDGSTVTDGTVVWRDQGVMERPWAEGPYLAEAA